MTATTLATTTPPTPWRRGITVFTREIIPGDHIMDRGVVREVANVSVAEGSNGNSLVNFEPMDGYPPTLCVPNRTQVYVRRACRNEHEAPPMPVVDDTMRTLFACPIEVG